MSAAGSSSMNSPLSAGDDWIHLTDPGERRKVQNRIAQRKYRDKAREKKAEGARQAANEQYAAGAYAAPDPDDLDAFEESGLPWGSFSLPYIIRTGQARERTSHGTSAHAVAEDKADTSR